MLVMLTLLACSRQGDDDKAARTQAAAVKPSPAVATVGLAAIRCDDLQRYLDQRAMGRAHDPLEKRIKDRLDEMITAEVMAPGGPAPETRPGPGSETENSADSDPTPAGRTG